MDTTKLKRFAQFARGSLHHQVEEQLGRVLEANSPARREQAEAVTKLEVRIAEIGKDAVIEAAAYTWFNRFCALRFMDANRYTRVGIVSPLPGQFQPQILANAKQGDIDESIVARESVRTKITGLLSGKEPSTDPQAEAYRLLVVAACNHWHTAMPFLFEKIQDYTELLMPEDLLSGKSILSYTREALTPAACEDVEAIGWLYQFYISEKKDLVFEGLKKNKKITPENIPAATQLFTPHWIVRYLVENSLGRLWLLNRPDSQIFKNMQSAGQDCYYIEPSEPETDFLKVSSPEEIKICDPACGSGHMLTYAFDLLYAIYEEAGYPTEEIPEKILTHNLYGVEIDQRAGELAAFALTMKAAAKLSGSKQRRFFRKAITPNICVLENVAFEASELKDYMDYVGRDLFTAPLQTTLRQFEEADNFGSLIRPELTDVAGIRSILKSQDFSSDWIYKAAHEKALKALEQADYLSPKYDVVVANPPYMGSKGMNLKLVSFAKKYYQNSKSDLFSMFIDQCCDLTRDNGHFGLIVLPSWLFLSSFEDLRKKLFSQYTLRNLIHMGRGIFGIDWGSSAFCITKNKFNNFYTDFFRPHKKNFQYINPNDIKKIFTSALKDPKYSFDFTTYGDENAVVAENNLQQIRYSKNVAAFNDIPGFPLAYWVSDNFINVFKRTIPIADIATPRAGLSTGDNHRFQRLWTEVSKTSIAFDCASSIETLEREEQWFPCNSGGNFRKWFGNNEVVVNWMKNGEEIRTFTDSKGKQRSRPQNTAYYFRPGVTWNKISAGSFAARRKDEGFVFDDTGRSAFATTEEENIALLAVMCSSITNEILKFLNPSMSFTSGDISRIPFPAELPKENIALAKEAISVSCNDWNAYEVSWEFTRSPLLNSRKGSSNFKVTYAKLRSIWADETAKMQNIEEENNRIFIEAYGLHNELTPEVPLKEITLTCNPHYRYGGKKTEAELEALLLADTMREFISYAVGCMFGRYSLDAPGLICANAGDSLADYLRVVNQKRRHPEVGSVKSELRKEELSFTPDDDNVIPMLDGEWFTDDISERFKTFLKLTFGTDNYDENLSFIESALGKKGKPLKIRDYFLKEFYTDHVKRYKKRPIYWLFASPKGSFNALIYMHRYRPETVGIVLNDYLRNFKTKLSARLDNETALSADASASKTDKTKALKEVEKLKKMLIELEEWESDILFPLASEKVEIDLDDGVKHNYPLFGKALKKIPGLS